VALDREPEDLLRQLAPQVLSVLVRRYGHFSACEDAVQEALLAASVRWPDDGIPNHPSAWLITAASRRVIDELRSEGARARREESVAAAMPLEAHFAPGSDAEQPPDEDDTLTLLFLCCHPAISPRSQIALTLRAFGGLTTAEIARAFLVPETAMAQRIGRAKATIKAAGATFALPPEPERTERLQVVLHVLYLIFTEGHLVSSGRELQRTDLTDEAIRLARALHALLPDDGEVAGLLALMLLTDARRGARTGADGNLVLLGEQDRARWDQKQIAEGVGLVSAALQATSLGPYQLQAAIAAVHSEAASAEATDWPQILALYGLLERVAPNPMFTLNRAVAVAEVKGPEAGLQLLAALSDEPHLRDHHRLHAVRGHLLERAGDSAAARTAYLAAARRTTSTPEKRYLESRAASLA
jgi:RNA polymerase sigma factor (sigma-70 family)